MKGFLPNCTMVSKGGTAFNLTITTVFGADSASVSFSISPSDQVDDVSNQVRNND